MKRQRSCNECGEKYEAKRSTSRFCSERCAKRAQRSSAAVVGRTEPRLAPSEDQSAGPVEQSERLTDEGLVSAVRRELEDAGRLDTIAGQLAVQLARQMTAVDAKGVAGLSKELRAVLVEALDGAAKPGSEPDSADVPDEVEEARQRRERKAREASGSA